MLKQVQGETPPWKISVICESPDINSIFHLESWETGIMYRICQENNFESLKCPPSSKFYFKNVKMAWRLYLSIRQPEIMVRALTEIVLPIVYMVLNEKKNRGNQIRKNISILLFSNLLTVFSWNQVTFLVISVSLSPTFLWKKACSQF